MKIVGLDLSLAGTGVATYDGGEIKLATIQGPDNRPLMERLDYVASRTLAKCGLAELVVIEEIAHTNMQGHVSTVFLHALIRFGLWRSRIPVVGVVGSQLKKFATGYGGSKKKAVGKALVAKEVLRRWKINAADDNQADATVLLQIGRCLKKNLVAEYPEEGLVLDAIIDSTGNASAARLLGYEPKPKPKKKRGLQQPEEEF